MKKQGALLLVVAALGIGSWAFAETPVAPPRKLPATTMEATAFTV